MKKPITIIPFIGALCTIAISMFAWGYSMGNRISANDANDAQRDKRIEIHESRLDRLSDKIDHSLVQMHEKCDRILYELKRDK